MIGRDARRLEDVSFPEPAPTGLDGQSAVAASLPLLTGIAVADAGQLYFTSREGAYMIEPGGPIVTLLQLRTLGAGQASPGGKEPPPESLFTGVGLSDDGAVLVMDTGQERLLRVFDGGFEVIVNSVSSLNGPSSLPGDNRLLLGRNGGEGICSYAG